MLIHNNLKQGNLASPSNEAHLGGPLLSSLRGGRIDLLRVLPSFFECLVTLHVYLEKAKTLLNFSSSISELAVQIENGSKIILYKLIEPV